MAYTPNSFGEPIGVTDQQIIDAFKSKNPDLQANMQEYMRTYNRSNSDLLDMVKHYAPEAVLDLNQIMSYTKLPNNQYAQTFSGKPFAPVTGGQLSQFGQEVAAAKAPGLTQPAQGMTGSGAIPPAAPAPPAPARPVSYMPQQMPETQPTGYASTPMQPRPESFNPATSQINAAFGGRSYQGGQPMGGVTGTVVPGPVRSLPAQTKEEQLRGIFGGIRR